MNNMKTLVEKFEKLEESLLDAELMIKQLENEDNLFNHKYELESLDEDDRDEIESLLFALNATYSRLSTHFYRNSGYEPAIMEEQA